MPLKLDSWIAARLRRGALIAARLAPLVALAAVSAPLGAASWQPIARDGASALLYVPVSAPSPAPAVVFFHGSGGSPEVWRSFLAPVADALGIVVISPRPVDALGFGIGDDARTTRLVLAAAAERAAIDPSRVALAGHSAGGAYAIVLAYSGDLGVSGVFSLSAPFRQVLALADGVAVPPPARLYYGTQDPNYTGGHFTAFAAMLDRLGVVHVDEIAGGYGHSTWPNTTLYDGFGFLAAQRRHTPGGCEPSATTLCLIDGRFAVTATWSEPPGADVAYVAPAQERDSGNFWFFAPNNWELTVKVLDGCGVNDRIWVFAGGLTHVAHTLRVREIATGVERVYERTRGLQAPLADIDAFPCP